MTIIQNTGQSRKAERRLIRYPFKHWWVGLLAVGLAGTCAYAYLARANEASPPIARQSSSRPSKAALVVVAEAKQGDIGVYLTGLGTVTPLNTVTVKTRVDGQLMSVHFLEGATVESKAPSR